MSGRLQGSWAQGPLPETQMTNAQLVGVRQQMQWTAAEDFHRRRVTLLAAALDNVVENNAARLALRHDSYNYGVDGWWTIEEMRAAATIWLPKHRVRAASWEEPTLKQGEHRDGIWQANFFRHYSRNNRTWCNIHVNLAQRVRRDS